MAGVTERAPFNRVLIHSTAEDVEDDEPSLIQAARLDPKAFGLLYQRYLTSIYRYLRARTPNEQAAADLTQQVFLKALASLPKYRPRGLPFAAWLFRIARNTAIDRYRRSRSYAGAKTASGGGIRASGNNNINDKEGNLKQFMFTIKLAVSGFRSRP